ncbi:DUF6262 family protein [Streptomyces sp. NPDC005181]|uniref:DUF6262 family protein n=1 Tax=Streptomyces sp. NPDC005181 TaxID=3156869 RepID=UPI0033BBA141
MVARPFLGPHRRRAALALLPAQRPAGGLPAPRGRRTVCLLGDRGAGWRPRSRGTARRTRSQLRRGPAQPRTPRPRPPRPGPPGRQEARTAAALAARRQRTEAALQRVREAVARLRREKARVSVAAVARRADVSRTFLYDNPEARDAIASEMDEAGEHRTLTLTDQDATSARRPGANARSTPRTPSRRPKPRSSPSAPESANSLARSATWKPSGPRKPSNGSPPRTPPSNNASAN